MTTAITPPAAAMNPSHVPMFALTRLNAVVIGCVMLNGASPDITGDVGGGLAAGLSDADAGVADALLSLLPVALPRGLVALVALVALVSGLAVRVLAVALLAVRIVAVSLLAVRILAVALLAVRVLAVALLPVRVLAVPLLAVRVLAVPLLAVGVVAGVAVAGTAVVVGHVQSSIGR
ncbi:hypothetical protein ACLB3A_02010 [Corynebacterium freneyi]|uniref:hypothetical protein n=1 Tax=Corynebacterium freneyi TaxID=134034 RepID=UPI00396C8456